MRLFRAKRALLKLEPNQENGSAAASKARPCLFSRLGLEAVRFFDASEPSVLWACEQRGRPNQGVQQKLLERV